MKQYLAKSFAHFLFNVLLVYLAYTYRSDDAAIYLAILLFLAPILIGIKNSVFEWLYYFIYSRDKLAGFFLDFLKKNDMPSYTYNRYLQTDASDYLSRVVSDKDMHEEKRIIAAYELGILNGNNIYGLYSYRLRLAYSHGLAKYMPDRTDPYPSYQE